MMNWRPGCAVTPDLSLAAYIHIGQELRVIDLQHDGRELWNDKSKYGTLVFSPDGKLLAAGGGDAGTDIRLWDAMTGQELDPLTGHQSWVTSLVFWPDGKRLASGSADQTIRIWDVPTRTCADTLRGHRQQVWELALMSDRPTLVSGCRDGTVCLWDTSASHPRRPRIEIPDVARAWAFEADSRSVVTFNDYGRVTRWTGPNFEFPEVVLETGEEKAGAYSFCFSSDGRRLAVGSALLFSVPVVSEELDTSVISSELKQALENHGVPLATNAAVTVIEAGKQWRIHDENRPFEIKRNKSGALNIYSPTAEVLRVWDLPSRSLWRQLPNSTGQARVFFGGGTRVLTLSLDDHMVHDFDLTTASEVQSWQAPSDVIHFSLSPDERQCVTLGYAGDVVLTDLMAQTTTKLNLDIRESHDGNFSPEGRLLVVPSSLGLVRICDATTWTEVDTLRGFFDDVWGSAFLPGGGRLVVAAGDREAIRLYDTSTSWDPSNWHDTLTLETEASNLWPLRISPDGSVIGATTFGGDWHLHLWRAPSLEEIDAVEADGSTPATRRQWPREE
jgi:WD40 repeat protein